MSEKIIDYFSFVSKIDKQSTENRFGHKINCNCFLELAQAVKIWRETT